MSTNDGVRGVRRRRLLRGAGTVAVAVAGAGAVGAIATPADAADGNPLNIGQANTGTLTTTLTAGSTANPVVRLNNSAVGGAPLSLKPLVTTTPNPNDPTTWTTEAPSTAGPVGCL